MRSKIANWMVFVVIMQGLLFLAAFFAIGAPDKVVMGESRRFEKSVDAGKIRIEELMLAARTTAEDSLEKIAKSFDYSGAQPFLPESGSAADIMISILEKSDISGVFVMYESGSDASSAKKCLYLRKDISGVKSIGTAYELLRGSPKLVEGRFVPKSPLWLEQQPFENACQDFRGDFYSRPVSAVGENTVTNAAQFGYWSAPFKLSDEDYSIVTYTIPLAGKNGRTFGVFGIELAAEAFEKNFVAYSRLPENDYSVALSVSDGGSDRLSFLTAASFQDKLTADNFYAGFSGSNYYHSSETHKLIIDKHFFWNNLAGYKTNLEPYGINAYFGDESWSIYCVARNTDIFSLYVQAAINVITALGITLAAGVAVAFILGYAIVNPIAALNKSLREINPEDQKIKLIRTNYREIDELSQSIELLSSDVANISSRMSKIISLVNLPLGAFEIKGDRKQVYLTDSLFELLGIKRGENSSNFVDIFFWKSFIDYAMQNKHPSMEDVYNIGFHSGAAEQWVRIKSYDEQHSTFGIVMDVTEQVSQMDKLEYERDYDVLTKLLNRRGFKARAIKLLEKYSDKVNALMLLDLDNLKEFNDTYGHDWGDRYIKLAGEMLAAFEEHSAIVARMSGDEFLVLLYGYQSKQDIIEAAGKVYAQVKEKSIVLPDQTITHVQLSAGLAFCPYDADNLKDLLKCADYAMYEIKNTTKGELKIYSGKEEKIPPYLPKAAEKRGSILQRAEFSFMLEPIAEVAGCRLHGYRLSLRSNLTASIDEIISIARQNGTFDALESTIHASAAAFLAEQGGNAGYKLFLSASSANAVQKSFALAKQQGTEKYFSSLVFELIELPGSGFEFLNENNIATAVNAFDENFSSTLAGLAIQPQYIKIDLPLLRGIESDEQKRQIFKNAADFAHSGNMRVIAAGIESFDELQEAVRLGADYLEGSLIGLPQSGPHALSRQLVELLQKLTDSAEYQI